LQLFRANSVLRLVVASFAAIQAIIISILAEPDLMFSLADAAIAMTLAPVFRLITLHADKLLRHEVQL
jgi:hypothetical protein